jgi:hypothetical protein
MVGKDDLTTILKRIYARCVRWSLRPPFETLLEKRTCEGGRWSFDHP